jgi:hypothetical protein
MGTVFENGGCGGCSGDVLRRIPVLRYLKDPVMELNDLYRKHPLGGQPGWYAFVFNAHTFAYWHHGRNKWELLPAYFTAETLVANLGFDPDDLVDGQLLMWDRENRRFRLYVLRTVDGVPAKRDTPGLYVVKGKGLYLVENDEVVKVFSPSDVRWEDIQDRPEVVRADWAESDSEKMSFIENKPDIVAPNDPAIVIKQGGVEVASFSLNQSTGCTVELDDGGEDSFNGYTLRQQVLSGDGGGTYIQIKCNVPPEAYDPVSGYFLNSNLMRIRLDIDPFNPSHSYSSGCTVSVSTHNFPAADQSWNLMDYLTGSQVLASALFFKREIYVRYNTSSHVLYWVD